MKKNVRSILILVCVAAALYAGYALVLSNENPAQTGMLYKLGNDQIKQVKLENQYGSFVFEQQEGSWVVETSGVYNTNPEKIDLLLSCLKEFKITRMLPQERSEYGFDKPQAKVSVVTNGGKKHSFVVGAEAIQGSSVYIKSNGRVMLTSTGMISQLTGSLAAYRAKDVLKVDPKKIRTIDYYIKGEKILSISNTDYQNWIMHEPFEAPARSVVLNEFVSKLKKLIIAQYVDADAAEDTGLDNPARWMVLTDWAGRQQKLFFGTVEGNFEYVRIGGEKDVVKLYASDLDFSQLTPQGVMYIAPLDIGIANVQSVSIQAGGKTELFTLQHKDDAVEGDSNISVQCNGADIALTDFVSVYFKCITLNADGFEPVQAGQSVFGECEAVCTTTLLNGEKVELSLYRRDADTLYMVYNGKMLTSGQMGFYLQKSSLKELLYRLQSITGL